MAKTTATARTTSITSTASVFQVPEERKKYAPATMKQQGYMRLPRDPVTIAVQKYAHKSDTTKRRCHKKPRFQSSGTNANPNIPHFGAMEKTRCKNV
jgi:hypothetical protein